MAVPVDGMADGSIAIAWEEVLSGAFLCGFIAAAIGARKGNAGKAFFVGFLSGPFGILFAILSRGNRVHCSFCHELMRSEARVCPHCQRTALRRVLGSKGFRMVMGRSKG